MRGAMRGQKVEVGWLVALGIPLLYLLTMAYVAWDANALGGNTNRFLEGFVWAFTVLSAGAGALGLTATLRKTSKSTALRFIKAKWGRPLIIAASLALGTLFLILTLRIETPADWSCTIENVVTNPPDPSRCPADEFAQMRSFKLRMSRISAIEGAPVVRARIRDRKTAAVSVDSDRGGLCVATGPDRPVRGESRLELSAECGANLTYLVNVHVCDVRAGDAGTLDAAAELEIREGNNASVIVCE